VQKDRNSREQRDLNRPHGVTDACVLQCLTLRPSIHMAGLDVSSGRHGWCGITRGGRRLRIRIGGARNDGGGPIAAVFRDRAHAPEKLRQRRERLLILTEYECSAEVTSHGQPV